MKQKLSDDQGTKRVHRTRRLRGLHHQAVRLEWLGDDRRLDRIAGRIARVEARS